VVTSLPQGVSGFIIAAIVAAALSPSINSLAATTVNDFYVKYVRPDADDATLMRVARTATIGWGVAQIAVGLGAQWVTRSVLDSGLSVLSLAAGPVLGAFLTGVLTTRVRSGAMLRGMAAGAAVLAWAGGPALRLHLVRAHRARRDERRGAAALLLHRDARMPDV
jgi:Na+/proline symporter